jgi:hypothetical protein
LFYSTRLEFSSYVSGSRLKCQYKWQRKQPKEILSLEGNAIFIWRAAQSTFSNFSFSAPPPCFLYPQTAPKVGPSPFSVYHIIPPLCAQSTHSSPGRFPAAGNLGPGIVINSNTRSARKIISLAEKSLLLHNTNARVIRTKPQFKGLLNVFIPDGNRRPSSRRAKNSQQWQKAS